MNKLLLGGLLTCAGVVAAYVVTTESNLLDDPFIHVAVSDVVFTGEAVRPSYLHGSWVEPVPGTAPAKQGFTLSAHGQASSINMDSLSYKSWTFEAGRLTLSGESCGNGECSQFSEGFRVESVGQKKLHLVDESGQLREYAFP